MENKLAVAFDNLVFTMQKYDLYQKGDEVDMDIETVQDTIREMLNRLSVVEVKTEKIRELVDEHKKSFRLLGFPLTMSEDECDFILNDVLDINMLIDLNERRPFDEDWEGMIKVEKPKSIDEQLTDFYLELGNQYHAFWYDEMSGTCHISLEDREFSYDCTPFWEEAKGISVCLNKNDEYLTYYIIDCEEPTNVVELEKFKEFYRIQVELMIKAIS